MMLPRGRVLALIGLATGLFLSIAYFVWQWSEPHGAGEFAYQPFTPVPLPYAPMRGFTYEQLWGHVRRIALLGPGMVLLVWGLAGRVTLPAPRELKRPMFWAVGACLLLTALLMLGVLRGRALIDDELAYAMQATFFKEWRLTGVDLGVMPSDVFSVRTALGYTAKYLPGEGLLQIPGILVGIPALMHLPCLGLTLWAWYQCLLRSSGERMAQLGTLALACSPMLAFTSATGLSHAAGLMWIVLMGLGVELARGGQPLGGAALSALSFGAGFMTRPQSLLPAGAVLGVALLWALWKARSVRGVLLALGLAGAGGAALLAYNHALSGSLWRLPWFLQCNAEHYGFGRVWAVSTYEHTPLRALENLAVVAVRLNAWWLGLPLSLGVLVAWLAWGRRSAGAGMWLGVGAAIVAFQFLYYSPGVSETGAVYHYELLLPGSIMAAVVVDTLLSRFSFGPLLVVTALVLGTGSWVVEQGLRLNRLVTTIHRTSDEALAQITTTPALLIHERLGSEAVSRGWIFDSFPRRFRGQSDSIVTFPRVSSDIMARAQRAYPGRSCWYFRYRPGTDTSELQRCEEAKALLERPPVDLPKAKHFVQQSTAYYKSSYFPVPLIAAAAVLGKDRQPLVACCSVRETEALGLKILPDLKDDCIETGEP
jgi:hypothetical protein